jgi:hypothetical protein
MGDAWNRALLMTENNPFVVLLVIADRGEKWMKWLGEGGRSSALAAATPTPPSTRKNTPIALAINKMRIAKYDKGSERCVVLAS